METQVRIETASPADAARLLAIYAPYVRETDITFEYDVPTQQEFRARVEDTLRRYPYLKAVRGEEIVGYAYAGPLKHRAAYDWSVEVSVYVRRGELHAGIGTALYAALEDCLARQGVTNLYACITVPNPVSIAFHEKTGYQTVGHYHRCGYKFGRWLDVIWMEKMLQPQPTPPAPLRPFAALNEPHP